MAATLITPLRKRKKTDGKLYTRPPGIEAKLLAISTLRREELSTRCGIQDHEDPQYLPSECLVYLVREHRTRAMDACSEALYKTLLERIIRGLPHGESADGERVRAFESSVGDTARDWFLTMLMEDREQYVEDLDIYEARFSMALKTLRLDAFRHVESQEKETQGIEIDPESGDISPEIERAAGSLDPFDVHKLDDPLYLSRLYKAIDDLRPLQKAILEMDRNEIPTESQDPKILTISAVLKKTSKTIRTQRALAHSALREALMKGEPR